VVLPGIHTEVRELAAQAVRQRSEATGADILIVAYGDRNVGTRPAIRREAAATGDVRASVCGKSQPALFPHRAPIPGIAVIVAGREEELVE